ncbi:MAG: vWA domain-containing protein [Candidatus Zixiibacteriota bacterium]
MFLSFGGYWLMTAILLAIALLTFVLFYYRRTNPPLSKGMRVFLGILRSVAIMLLLFSLAEPVFSYLLVKELPPHVAVLFDNSESVKNVEDFQTKREVLKWLSENPFPGEVGDEFIRDDYRFSDSIETLDDTLGFDGKRTALGDCLTNMREKYSEQNLQGVIVISDGLVNSGTNPLKAASELSVPVYALDLGAQRSSNDVRIVRMTHDEVGYAGRQSQIEVEIESRGYDGLSLPVRIRSASKTLATEDITLTGGASRQTRTIDFVPPEEGIRTFSVSLPKQSGEELTDNNVRSFSMKILKSKQKILVAAGYLSWEVTFLKRVLDESEDFDCDLSVFDRSGKLRTTPFPQSPDKLAEYDLVILVDYSPSILASKGDALSSYLSSYGKAVFFLLGAEFARSTPSGPLADLLPFEFASPPTLRQDGDFHLRLTKQGEYHPVMQIAETASQLQKQWDDMPPFEAYVTAGKEKPGATVLAVHQNPDFGGNLIPLVAINRVEKGKVLTTCFVPLWKAEFLSKGRGGTGDEYRTFINSCVRWLVTTEDVDRVRIAPDKSVFKSGERVTFSASLLDESYQAIDDGSVILTVIPDSATTSDTLISSMVRIAPGKMKTDMHLLDHGNYSYSAELIRGDKTEAKISGRFVVEAFSLEEETLYETEDLLREIAATTGGRHYPISMLDSLLTQADFASGELRTRKEYPLANHWIIMLAVLLLLSTEWAIRKRMQLM